MTLTRKAVIDWLRENYLSSTQESAMLLNCIASQLDATALAVLDARADRFAGAQESGGGPAEFTAGLEFAMTALVECHEGPHADGCPYA